jgi:hypothetical protein
MVWKERRHERGRERFFAYGYGLFLIFFVNAYEHILLERKYIL